jgi:DNA-binding NarL/FixJ family response regulator
VPCVNLSGQIVPTDLSPTVRVVVADSQPVFRYGLKRLLDETHHLRVVGEAGDPAQAIQAVRQHEPDVLVINPGIRGNALGALKALDGLPKPVRCVVVTSGPQRYAPAAVWSPPVVGSIPRESPGAAFLTCIQSVMQDQSWFGGVVAPIAPGAAPAPEVSPPCRLTPRETQIVCAVVDGASNKGIAAELSIAEDTVKHHLSSIFNKLGVDSRLELALFALYHGLVQWM